MTDLGNIRARIAPLTAAVCFVLLSWIHARLMLESIVSFSGSMVLAAQHPGELPRLFGSDALEYWIAAAAWCAAPFFIARRLITPHGTGSGMLERAAHATLVVCIFLALTAPIIAPLPPLAQGASLQHDRMLPPFSSGMCSESEPSFHPLPGAGIIATAVGAAEQYLLRRSITFSQVPAPSASPHTAERDVTVKQSTIMFVFGTDGVGRDILSRVVYGARYSLGIGFIVVLISLGCGTVAGMISGYAGGIIDAFIMRGVDVLLSIPPLFLALTVMAILGQSLTTMVIVLSATWWMSTARLLRGEVVSLRGRDFIAASRLLGTSHADILRLHIVPNILPTIKSAGILQLGNIILAEASLSFLGLGIQSPEPSWGNMIADSMANTGAAVYVGIFPGLALSLLIIAVHIIGEHSR